VPGTRQLLAIALVAIGALWLLIEIGFVPPSLTRALLHWWPLLLVGFGLDLAIPASKRGPAPITVYAAAAILLIALTTRGQTPTTPEAAYRQPLPANARSMTAIIELGSVKSSLGPADPGVAVNAEFDAHAPSKVELTGATDLQFELRRPRSTLFDFSRSEWQVQLTPEVPLTLDLRTGSGTANVDLRQFDITSLIVDSGSGSTHLQLPGGGTYYRADVGTGSGSTNLTVDAGASLDLILQTGSGSVNVAIDEGTDLQLVLATRSGAVTLDLPDDAPIRVEIQDDGSGRVRLPNYLNRRSGTGDTGTWQSQTYERGGRVINITVVDVGSGSITFR